MQALTIQATNSAPSHKIRKNHHFFKINPLCDKKIFVIDFEWAIRWYINRLAQQWLGSVNRLAQLNEREWGGRGVRRALGLESALREGPRAIQSPDQAARQEAVAQSQSRSQSVFEQGACETFPRRAHSLERGGQPKRQRERGRPPLSAPSFISRTHSLCSGSASLRSQRE